MDLTQLSDDGLEEQAAAGQLLPGLGAMGGTSFAVSSHATCLVRAYSPGTGVRWNGVRDLALNKPTGPTDPRGSRTQLK